MLQDGSELTLPLKKHSDIYISIEDAKETMYTDQTGAFPVQSRRGNRYIMVLCEIDGNIIISEAMKTERQEKLCALTSS